MEVDGAFGVAGAVPDAEDFGAGGGGGVLEGGEGGDPAFVDLDDAGDLGLLGADGGDEGEVWVSGATPGEGLFVFVVPIEEEGADAAESLGGDGGGGCRCIGGGCHGCSAFRWLPMVVVGEE